MIHHFDSIDNLADMDTSNGSLNLEFDGIVTKIQMKKGEIQSIQERLAVARADFAQTSAEVMALNTQVEASERQTHILLAQIDKLNEDLKPVRMKARAVEEDVKAYTDNESQLKSELKIFEQTKERLGFSLQAVQEAATAARKKTIDNANKDRASRVMAIQRAEEEAARLKSENDKAEQEMECTVQKAVHDACHEAIRLETLKRMGSPLSSVVCKKATHLQQFEGCIPIGNTDVETLKSLDSEQVVEYMKEIESPSLLSYFTGPTPELQGGDLDTKRLIELAQKVDDMMSTKDQPLHTGKCCDQPDGGFPVYKCRNCIRSIHTSCIPHKSMEDLYVNTKYGWVDCSYCNDEEVVPAVIIENEVFKDAKTKQDYKGMFNAVLDTFSPPEGQANAIEAYRHEITSITDSMQHKHFQKYIETARQKINHFTVREDEDVAENVEKFFMDISKVLAKLCNSIDKTESSLKNEQLARIVANWMFQLYKVYFKDFVQNNRS